jgi:polyhydroxyalkanoate synthesis regulator phasin
MQEFIKNFFYLGAGAAFMTKEKMDELKNEFIEKGKMTQDEGKKFVDEWIKKSEEARADIEKRIQESVNERLEKMNIATRDDIHNLQSQIDVLRLMVEQTQAPGLDQSS